MTHQGGVPIQFPLAEFYLDSLAVRSIHYVGDVVRHTYVVFSSVLGLLPRAHMVST